MIPLRPPIMTDYRTGWMRRPHLGIAVMPSTRLHAYADRKGWKRATDEITDGPAAHRARTGRGVRAGTRRRR
jgi:hypothetical protein